MLGSVFVPLPWWILVGFSMPEGFALSPGTDKSNPGLSAPLALGMTSLNPNN